ncbi:MAG: type 2 isopentenyl-diphosphate Delta-isomerase [Promethearchaeota archaeon]
MPNPKSSKEIRDRKIEHLKIPIEHDVQHSKNYFKYIKLIHNPLPEMDFKEVDLSTQFFSKKISAPICISAITGGHPVSEKINEILARAAQEENIIMSVGSQRAGIENTDMRESFEIVREVAPDIPIIGNIGIGQVSKPDFSLDYFNGCVDMIKADIMAIHLNSLHELVQDGGDISYKLFQQNFKKLRNSTDIPIIGKEVGSGFNEESTRKLEELGFDGFDVGGAGGTSFAAIEEKRNQVIKKKYSRNPAKIFREWGNPTPISIINVRKVSQKPIIATGGLKTGVDIAKSIVLGADIGGFAYKFLVTAWKDFEEETISNTIREIQTLKNELQSCMWLMNIGSIKELKSNINKGVILGKLYNWINQ